MANEPQRLVRNVAIRKTLAALKGEDRRKRGDIITGDPFCQ
jgi:hypothetical protein